eukprot:267245-Rhodomonas_salina.2
MPGTEAGRMGVLGRRKGSVVTAGTTRPEIDRRAVPARGATAATYTVRRGFCARTGRCSGTDGCYGATRRVAYELWGYWATDSVHRSVNSNAKSNAIAQSPYELYQHQYLSPPCNPSTDTVALFSTSRAVVLLKNVVLTSGMFVPDTARTTGSRRRFSQVSHREIKCN